MYIIQEQRVIAPLRNAYPVVGPVHGGEIAYEQQALLLVVCVSDKAEDATVAVVGIDPLEAIPVVVRLLQGRILFVNVEQIPHILLQIAVQILLRQIPVQADLLIPLVELSEILPHEQELFARMAHHEGVAHF